MSAYDDGDIGYDELNEPEQQPAPLSRHQSSRRPRQTDRNQIGWETMTTASSAPSHQQRNLTPHERRAQSERTLSMRRAAALASEQQHLPIQYDRAVDGDTTSRAGVAVPSSTSPHAMHSSLPAGVNKAPIDGGSMKHSSPSHRKSGAGGAAAAAANANQLQQHPSARHHRDDDNSNNNNAYAPGGGVDSRRSSSKRRYIPPPPPPPPRHPPPSAYSDSEVSTASEAYDDEEDYRPREERPHRRTTSARRDDPSPVRNRTRKHPAPAPSGFNI